MKLLLMTRYEIGLNVLRFLLHNFPDDVAAVVTFQGEPAFSLAKENNIPTFLYTNEKDLIEFLKRSNIVPDLGAMVWWPFIIKPPLIAYPKRGFINTHPSLLPYCRGSMSNFFALVEKKPYGVSIHTVDKAIDHGDILVQEPIEVTWTDTDETLYHKSLHLLEDLFIQNYPKIRDGSLLPHRQNFAEGTYHTLKDFNNAIFLDLEKPTTARDVLNLLRARSYKKKPGCRFVEDGHEYEVRIKITQV